MGAGSVGGAGRIGGGTTSRGGLMRGAGTVGDCASEVAAGATVANAVPHNSARALARNKIFIWRNPTGDCAYLRRTSISATPSALGHAARHGKAARIKSRGARRAVAARGSRPWGSEQSPHVDFDTATRQPHGHRLWVGYPSWTCRRAGKRCRGGARSARLICVPDAAASVGLRFRISDGLLANCGLPGVSHRRRSTVQKAWQSVNKM
jgi:hypothetical protein